MTPQDALGRLLMAMAVSVDTWKPYALLGLFLTLLGCIYVIVWTYGRDDE